MAFMNVLLIKSKYLFLGAAGGNYVQVKDGLDSEEADKTGIDLGATGRLALMAKLAEGTGMKLPEAANAALQTTAIPGANTVAAAAAARLAR